ncbi:hypothetical protein IJJ27_00510 [bacterium]|nr:hypothetical protein [bacterium]
MSKKTLVLSLLTAAVMTLAAGSKASAQVTYSSNLPVAPTTVTPVTPVPTPVATPRPVATPVPVTPTPLPVTAGGDNLSYLLVIAGLTACVAAAYRLKLKD